MKHTKFLLLLPIMWVLAGCPVSMDYPLGYQDKDAFDERLIGTWSASDTSTEVLKVRFAKIDAHSFHAEVLQRGSMYVEEVDAFTGWCTTLNGQTFMYFQNAADKMGGYYSYIYWFDGQTLVASDFSLKVGGVDAVTSIEAYRREVMASMQYSDFKGTPIYYSKVN